MAFEVEMITPNLMYVTYLDPMNLREDLKGVVAASAEAAGATSGTIVRVGDGNQMSSMGFSDLVLSLGQLINNEPGSLRDKRFLNVFVHDQPIAKMASDFMKQAQYGGMMVPVFPERAEALEWAHQFLSEQQGEAD
ncbi:MAG: hypothetical protein GYB68_01040 [Chloroflexi bacterium]|nr:hypothetical protein [Chloroflexota bacterium]